MSRGTSHLAAAVLVCVILSVTDSTRPSDQTTRLATANAKFAFEIYQRQTAATTGNIFMSPLSISVALAMTYLGARGNTKTQMKDVMHLGEVDEAHLNQAFSDLRSALNKPNQPYALYMANRLFGEKSYTFMEEFLSTSLKYLGAQLAPVDFRGDVDGAVATINRWVAENTNSKITEIVTRDSVTMRTLLVLVNAVYFKANWTQQFTKSLTQNEDFHVSPSQTVKVQMMHMRTTSFSYGFSDELQCQTIELPYEGDAISMFILLPNNTVTSLSQVERKLSADHLRSVEMKFNMAQAAVEVWLPKFVIDEKISLSSVLADMGMKDLFSFEKADLSGISGKPDLVVSDVFHRAFVNVSEEGTEAAAVTAVLVELQSAHIPRQSYKFRADHPFLFFIKHKPTGSILFLGRLKCFDAGCEAEVGVGGVATVGATTAFIAFMSCLTYFFSRR